MELRKNGAPVRWQEQKVARQNKPVPALYHEIYHVYGQFRQVARGGRPARPNLSQTDMWQRAGRLSGTAVSGDTRFATEWLVDALLGDYGFLAMIGPSGSGKSSLAHAG